jgi:hypothetical protein
LGGKVRHDLGMVEVASPAALKKPNPLTLTRRG